MVGNYMIEGEQTFSTTSFLILSLYFFNSVLKNFNLFEEQSLEKFKKKFYACY